VDCFRYFVANCRRRGSPSAAGNFGDWQDIFAGERPDRGRNLGAKEAQAGIDAWFFEPLTADRGRMTAVCRRQSSVSRREYVTTKGTKEEIIHRRDAEYAEFGEKRDFTTKCTKGTKKEIIHRRGAEDTEFGKISHHEGHEGHEERDFSTLSTKGFIKKSKPFVNFVYFVVKNPNSYSLRSRGGRRVRSEETFYHEGHEGHEERDCSPQTQSSQRREILPRRSRSHRVTGLEFSWWYVSTALRVTSTD
jgi:hypothetical protein